MPKNKFSLLGETEEQSPESISSEPVKPILSKTQKIIKAERWEAGFTALEMGDVTAIFVMKAYFAALFTELLRMILFPAAAAAALFRAIFRIRAAYLETGENKKTAVAFAVVETLSALAITTAVVGTFAAAALFALAAPILFTAALGLKTIFHLALAGYYWVKAESTDDKAEKMLYKNKAKINAFATLVSAVTTVGAGLVFIGQQASLGLFGIIGGGCGVVYAVAKAVQSKRKERKTQSDAEFWRERQASHDEIEKRLRSNDPMVELERMQANAPDLRKNVRVMQFDITITRQDRKAQVQSRLRQLKGEIKANMSELQHKISKLNVNGFTIHHNGNRLAQGKIYIDNWLAVCALMKFQNEETKAQIIFINNALKKHNDGVDQGDAAADLSPIENSIKRKIKELKIDDPTKMLDEKMDNGHLLKTDSWDQVYAMRVVQSLAVMDIMDNIEQAIIEHNQLAEKNLDVLVEQGEVFEPDEMEMAVGPGPGVYPTLSDSGKKFKLL